MDGPGFHVEPDVLDDAAHGMAETVADQDAAELGTLTGPPERYGHEGVHAAFAEFCAAWTIGADALRARALRNGTSLSEVARAYREADMRTAQRIDPALPVVEPERPLRR